MMRLLIIGLLDGQVGAAGQIAIERGAKVLHTAGCLRRTRGFARRAKRRPGHGRCQA
ncbi:MAG: hypothetical protein FD153_1463 [Rhodospirillaceae bacterium]|nr:MAG: hypothetical protein FD153_1463 [Rhodospirillaceae bacterium]